jgi:cyanophycinase-like exopeptidase
VTVCLQGGGEFSPACREMDADLVRRAGGRVVVSALAAAPGRDYATATANGVTHFRAVGAAEVVGAPDVREDRAGALEALRSADLLVLPGGSPSRLLTALRSTPVGDVVHEVLGRGGVVMGASAGAMVLCPWTVLPDRRGPSGMEVAAGLGAVPGVAVVPHWSGGSSRGDWLRLLATEDVVVLGLPEESGVVAEQSDGEVVLTAVGRRGATVVGAGLDGEDLDLSPGEAFALPVR